MNVGYIQLGNLTADPASPQDGQMWYNSTLGKFRVRENGVTKDDDTGGNNNKINLGYTSNMQITIGLKANSVVKMPKSGIFSRWDITSDVATNSVVNVRKNGTLIFTSNKPTLTAQRSNSGTNMAGTTNSYSAGDLFELDIETNNNATYILLTLS